MASLEQVQQLLLAQMQGAEEAAKAEREAAATLLKEEREAMMDAMKKDREAMQEAAKVEREAMEARLKLERDALKAERDARKLEDDARREKEAEEKATEATYSMPLHKEEDNHDTWEQKLFDNLEKRKLKQKFIDIVEAVDEAARTLLVDALTKVESAHMAAIRTACRFDGETLRLLHGDNAATLWGCFLVLDEAYGKTTPVQANTLNNKIRNEKYDGKSGKLRQWLAQKEKQAKRLTRGKAPKIPKGTEWGVLADSLRYHMPAHFADLCNSATVAEIESEKAYREWAGKFTARDEIHAGKGAEVGGLLGDDTEEPPAKRPKVQPPPPAAVQPINYQKLGQAVATALYGSDKGKGKGYQHQGKGKGKDGGKMWNGEIWRAPGSCGRCGSFDHFFRDCPKKGGGAHVPPNPPNQGEKPGILKKKVDFRRPGGRPGEKH